MLIDEKNENILITGSTGVGKSYLGTALGYQACIQGFKVSYFNTSKLFAKLKMAKADGSYLRELAKIERQDVIILDDFGLQALDSHNRITLLEIIEDRPNHFTFFKQHFKETFLLKTPNNFSPS